MIDFFISPDTEKQKLMDIFCCKFVGVSLEYRAKQYQFPLEMANKMQFLPRIQWDEELEGLLDVAYFKNQNELEKSVLFFNDFWQRNNKKYLSPLNTFFGESLPNYRVLLACYLDVISNWKECNIVINYSLYKKENVLYHVYSVLFEMVLSQIFIKIRAIKNKTQMSDSQVWGRAELSACAILNKLYPEFKNSTKTGYPKLDVYAPLFLKTINHSNNLKDFLNAVIQLTLPFDEE